MKPIIFIITFLLFFVNTTYAIDRCAEYVPDIRAASLQYIGLDYPYWYNIGCAQAESSCRGNLTSFDGGIGLFQLTPSTGIVKEISKYLPVDPYNVESNIKAQSFYLGRIINVHFKSGDKTIGTSKYKLNPKEHVEICGLHLSDVYRFYNSGYWFFAEARIKYKGPQTETIEIEKPKIELSFFDSLVIFFKSLFGYKESIQKEFITKTIYPNYSCSNNDMAKNCVRGGTCVNKKYLSFCDVSYSYPLKVWNYSQQYKGLSDGPWSYWFIESDKKINVSFPSKECN